ncbi:amidohydrolase family protein [Iamia majanohamensis]|uniref:Amidohydrolase family protein n=1 Tax=Iamia majanohamensis TaxID=467976 RepID=A0AAF0BV34_9ACTN|nr:amidohydrolase family protein [Iamia majanohamensis]WCO66385.1 amidohydrolase family protein [Iamia majanohamensis]
MTADVTPAEGDLPLIISVDDHVMEPKDLWQRELPAHLRDRGPRVVTERVRLEFSGGHYGFTRDVEDGEWCDLWLFDDLVVPTGLLHGPAGLPRDEQRNVPARYEDLRPGTWDRTERLADMDRNHVEAAINYPNVFPRFAGQGFLERDDKDLALTCLCIYNDWMVDEWSGTEVPRRLIPLTLVPLWDPALAAEEVRRCAAKGSHAIAFTENPSKLGLPSLYTGDWDVLWQAAVDTETTVSMHIGSSSSMPSTAPDAPLATSMSLYAQNAQGSLADWVFSGTLERFPDIKVAYAESQVGWMPFQLERMDAVWAEGRGGVGGPVLPSEQVAGRVFGCVFDDLHGLRCRHDVGLSQILFETDYPHSDGTFPHSRKVAHDLFAAAGMDAEECRAVLRGNAVAAYGLERFGLQA